MVLFIHFIATLVRRLGPGGVRSIVAEPLLLPRNFSYGSAGESCKNLE